MRAMILVARRAGLVLTFCSLGALPAAAIPSPELVVGSLSSLSQVFAVLSAMLGGGALALGRAGRGADAGRERRLVKVAGALGLLCVLSLGLNAYLVLSGRSAERARLEATLLRPAAKSADGRLLDPALKELSYREQVGHPRGMTVEQAERALADAASGARDDLVVLDIRETAETEMGSLPGARAIRYPDLPRSGLDVAGKTALLFCHNGNRSAETCIRLASQGIDCRFLVGGLEKWLAEGRSLMGRSVRNIDDLRAIPSFRNEDVLLDTGEVHALIGDDRALLVDVRYPGEYAAGHMPGAINLPIRPTPTAELQARLAALPDRPVIAPCYDRRSCFFASILGLELDRLGRDFRGRYTTPWEYFVPAPRPPHVEALIAAASESRWSRAAAWLAQQLEGGAHHVGLPLAIALLALLSRLLVLPFSVKSERDQIVSRHMASELEELRKRLASDPPRQARAIRALHRRHGLTPGFNLIALLFLPVLALSVEAVQRTAQHLPQPLLWIGNLAERDPTLALPALGAAALALYVHWALAATAFHRRAIWLVLFPLLLAALALLPAAGALYVTASGVLLLVQRAVLTLVPRAVRGFEAWRTRERAFPLLPGVVSLAEPERLVGSGNKAYRLARLAAAGLPVPPGLVLTAPALQAFAAADERTRRRIARAVWRRLGKRPLAVRSSAAGEDGGEMSFAGVFETRLDVARDDLASAIAAVNASFAASRTSAYGGEAGEGAILLQPMVPARYAGVAFTEDPAAPGLCLVEMVEGLGEQLVSGRAVPQSYRIGRAGRACTTAGEPPIDLGPLVDLALAAERLFGAPQDIEWAYRDGRFVLLQSRDITAVAGSMCAAVRDEWRRLGRIAQRAPSQGAILERTEMSELLPRPTPLSLSLLERLWQAGGSVDLACRRLGIAYPVAEDQPPYHETAFTRLYVDAREQAARTLAIGALAARRLERGALTMELALRKDFLPGFLADMRRHEIADPNRMSNDELSRAFRDLVGDFLTRTHPETEVVNIAARFHMDRARARLVEEGRDPAEALAVLAPTHLEHALERAFAAEGALRRRQLEHCLGHRAAYDYELAEPRYGEQPGGLEALARTMLSHAGRNASAGEAWAGLSGTTLLLVRRACRFQVLKEDAKHHALRQVAQLRRLMLALDERFELDGLAPFLLLDEMLRLDAGCAAELRWIAGGRKLRHTLLGAAPAPAAQLGAREIDLCGQEPVGGAAEGGALRGQRVSGTHSVVVGRAYVVDAAAAEQGTPLVGLTDADILVAPWVNPQWLGEMLQARAVVSETGGWLSHMAILARERGVPMVVGVRGLSAIRHGMVLHLHGDGTIEPGATPDEEMPGPMAIQVAKAAE